MGISWSEKLSENIVTSWSKWTQDVTALATWKIPRCLRRFDDIPIEYQLHTFTGASEYAYGAATYLRCTYEDKSVTVSLVMAKSRVAPVHQLSTPRLELQPGVFGYRLMEVVKKELDLPITATIYWTDSLTVLQWIHSKSRRFKAFVGHRVGEILRGIASKAVAPCSRCA